MRYTKTLNIIRTYHDLINQPKLRICSRYLYFVDTYLKKKNKSYISKEKYESEFCVHNKI